MQSKGAIRVVAILIALACLYQRSFTWATRYQEKKAEAFAAKAVEAVKATPEYTSVSELDRAYFIDSLTKVKNRQYTDSISAEKVFLGFTFKEVKEKEIRLGLDLKGGMNIMLQVQLKDLVNALSNNNETPQFKKALQLAEEREVESRQDFITLFAQAWDEVAPGQRLSAVFGTYELKDKIRPETSNSDVISVIKEQAAAAISNSFNVLRSRIDRFGVTSPNIQRLGNSGRILVELPGVKEPERVRKLLQGTASLEFWPTYNASEVLGYLQQADVVLRDALSEKVVEDTVAVADVADAASSDKVSVAEIVKDKINAADSLSADQKLVA